MYVEWRRSPSKAYHGSRNKSFVLSNFTGLTDSFSSSYVKRFSPSCPIVSNLFKAKNVSRYRFVFCFL